MPKNTPARIIDTQKTRAASFLGGGGGTGTVKMNGTTSRNSSGWLKIYSGVNTFYVPLFSTIDG